jgi:hypothetical protein
MGIKDLIRALSPSELWVFDSIHLKTLRDYYHRIMSLGARDPVESALHVRPGTVLEEVLAIRKSIRQYSQSRSGKVVRLLRAKECFKLCADEIQVRCLTPGNKCTISYRERISEVSGDLLEELIDQRRSVSVPSVNHNLTSSALLFEYGSTRLLLLADAEEPLWKNWRDECSDGANLEARSVQFIKVAHHGSINGYFFELYESACSSRSSVAVITPFVRGGASLPSREGIASLTTHLHDILCTNRVAADNSTEFQWSAPPEEEEMPALPPEWARDLVLHPDWISFLCPPRGDQIGLRKRSLQSSWIAKCLQQPKLIRLVHPMVGIVGKEKKRGNPVEENLISVYFDSEGKEIEQMRYIGSRAGKLNPSSQAWSIRMR